MASSERDIHEKIATAKIKQYGPTDIYYVGGSTFELDFKNAQGEYHPTVRKDVIDNFVAKNQIRLLNVKRYKEICDAIDPVTGETKTHNADGTIKSKLAQMTSALEDDGFLEKTSEGTIRVADGKNRGNAGPDAPDAYQQQRQQRQQPAEEYGTRTPRRTHTPIGDPFADGDEETGNRRRPPQQTPQPSRRFSEDDLFGDDDEDDDDMPSTPPNDDAGRDNGSFINPFDDDDDDSEDEPDGIRDDMRINRRRDDMGRNDDPFGDDDRGDATAAQRPIARKPKVIPLILFTGASVALCIGLFFGSYFLTTTLTGNTLKPLQLPAQTQQQTDTNQQGANASTGNQQQSANGSAEELGGGVTVDRNDFDPEDVVIEYRIASDSQQDIAVGFFTSLKNAFANGDVTTFNSMVAVDSIASQIASVYASYAQMYQSLTQSETEDLADYYAQTLAEQERQHVVDKDSYGSMFGGRIREVRVDDDDENRLYVVMESLGGDHQRACFVLQGDPSTGSYALTEMMDVNGYVKMIMQGTTDANQQEIVQGGGDLDLDVKTNVNVSVTGGNENADNENDEDKSTNDGENINEDDNANGNNENGVTPGKVTKGLGNATEDKNENNNDNGNDNSASTFTDQ